MPRKAAELTGLRFGRLLVLAREGSAQRRAMWRCQCDCGNSALVPSGELTRGKTKSCGCWRREAPTITKRRHGYARTPLYNVWRGMLNRCENVNQPHYERYGGRGIRVCERWHDFVNFLADMGDRPSPQHSLERIDNNGHYEPGNVRWATASEQRRNARTGAIGARHGNAKLTEKDVRAIRQSALTGVQLARAFKISRSVVSAVRRGRTWKHVT